MSLCFQELDPQPKDNLCPRCKTDMSQDIISCMCGFCAKINGHLSGLGRWDKKKKRFTEVRKGTKIVQDQFDDLYLYDHNKAKILKLKEKKRGRLTIRPLKD